MDNFTKLAYAYGSLMAKTAQNTNTTPSAALTTPTTAQQLEALKIKQELRRRKKLEEEYAAEQEDGIFDEIGDYFQDPNNRDKIIDRAALGTTGLALSGGIGALGASEASNRLRDAGFSGAEIRDVLTAGGGAARGAGKALLGAGAGAGIGYGAGALYNHFQKDSDKIKNLESMLGTLGGIGGAGVGTALGYSGEIDRADEAIAGRELDRIMNAARKGKKYKSKVLL